MAPPFTMPLSAIASFQDLRDYLREEGVAHEADTLAQVVEAQPLGEGRAAPMFVRWEIGKPLVQVVQPVLGGVPAGRDDAVEHALAFLNHSAPLAGLGFDRDRRFIYFRVTLQRDEQDKVAVPAFNRALRAAVVAAAETAPCLNAVAYRGFSIEQWLTSARAAASA